MKSTFIIHEGLYVFGNLGEVYMNKLYETYCAYDSYTGPANSLSSKYFVSGTYKSLPYEATISHMDKITLNQCCELIVTGSAMLNYKLLVHPNQKFWQLTNDWGGYQEIKAKDITKPGTKIASLNGALTVESVGYVNRPETFYILECGNLVRPTNDYMRSLYASNLILLPMKDEDIKDDLPFFVIEEE